jgi:hypothetical protein
LSQQPLLAEASIVPALESLLSYAEDREQGGFHHTVVVGKVQQAHVDSIWLEQAGYRFSKGSGKSNFAQWVKHYTFPGITISHLIHTNGTWSLQITPRLVQDDPERMMSYCHQILTSAFTGADSYHVVVRRFEKSRADSGPVLEWMKARNIKEVKVYLHDNYEARVEVTYLDPAFSPKTSALLAYLG